MDAFDSLNNLYVQTKVEDLKHDSKIDKAIKKDEKKEKKPEEKKVEVATASDKP